MSAPSIHFDNSYARLPPRFYAEAAAEPASAPRTIRVNEPLARQLGFDPAWLASEEGAQLLAGNRAPDGARSIATAYAGHQFGSFNPQLGDGRALLLGEILDREGQRFDLQLKGSGRTPFSRGGDGRAPLGPVLREYVVSEAMQALGIPTTRSLAAVTTGNVVFRERPLPGAVLARVARSHIRIGTFEFFAARGDREGLELLLGHVLDRHYPELRDAPCPALALLGAVVERQARLIARWQLVGFIHGVMNTDNMLVSGETIDYGPCAFMDAYDPDAVFSSIDVRGRYAYQNQPAIARWNLFCLARTLLPLSRLDPERARAEAQQRLDWFSSLHEEAYAEGMSDKLGLTFEEPDDAALGEDLLAGMHAAQADFTLTFLELTERAGQADPTQPLPAGHPVPTGWPAQLEPWLERWAARLAREARAPADRQQQMRTANPALIPRNHQVEAAIQQAVTESSFDHFHRLVDALADPHVPRPEHAPLMLPPTPEQRVTQTFCGT